MKKIQILLVLTAFSSLGFCQKKAKFSREDVSFIFSKTKIKDSTDLNVNIIYRNRTSDSMEVYKTLEEGDLNDKFNNVHIEFEKQQGKLYKVWSPRHILSKSNDWIDSLRHYDLPRKFLLPKCADTLSINLLDVAYNFYPANYRFRVHLRNETIRNNQEYNDTTYSTYPPVDKINYLVSRWFYFSVDKTITIRQPRHVE